MAPGEIEKPKPKWSKGKMLAFGVLVFVVVLASLFLVQLAGWGAYSGFVAGVAAGLAAILGSLMLFRPSAQT